MDEKKRNARDAAVHCCDNASYDASAYRNAASTLKLHGDRKGAEKAEKAAESLDDLAAHLKAAVEPR